MTEEEKQAVADCDLIIWYQLNLEYMNSRYVKLTDKKKKDRKTDLGYKYNILLFKEQEERDKAELFSAIIGDEMGYVERMGKSGYSGLMFRVNSHKIDDIKTALFELLEMFGFSDKLVRKYLKEAK
jgi:hypothetical protein